MFICNAEVVDKIERIDGLLETFLIKKDKKKIKKVILSFIRMTRSVIRVYK